MRHVQLPRKRTPEQEALLDFHLKELAHFTVSIMEEYSDTVAFLLPEGERGSSTANPDFGRLQEGK